MMKLAVLLLSLCALVGCGSYPVNGSDPISGEKTESVKMGFWDGATLVLWGVPYNRFLFELQATGGRPAKSWTAIVECKNINLGPSFTIVADGQSRTYTGRLIRERTMSYDLSEDDVQAMARAKTLTLSVSHLERRDDATLHEDQLESIRTLWAKHGT